MFACTDGHVMRREDDAAAACAGDRSVEDDLVCQLVGGIDVVVGVVCRAPANKAHDGAVVERVVGGCRNLDARFGKRREVGGCSRGLDTRGVAGRVAHIVEGDCDRLCSPCLRAFLVAEAVDAVVFCVHALLGAFLDLDTADGNLGLCVHAGRPARAGAHAGNLGRAVFGQIDRLCVARPQVEVVAHVHAAALEEMLLVAMRFGQDVCAGFPGGGALRVEGVGVAVCAARVHRTVHLHRAAKRLCGLDTPGTRRDLFAALHEKARRHDGGQVPAPCRVHGVGVCPHVGAVVEGERRAIVDFGAVVAVFCRVVEARLLGELLAYLAVEIRRRVGKDLHDVGRLGAGVAGARAEHLKRAGRGGGGGVVHLDARVFSHLDTRAARRRLGVDARGGVCPEAARARARFHL